MKIKLVSFLCFFAAITWGNAQKTVKQSKTTELSTSSKAEKNNNDIPFPTTLESLTKIYGSSYEEIPDPSTGKNYYKWNFEKGTVLIFVLLTDKDQYVGIVAPDEGEEPLSGLPFDLVFNQTTFDECRYIFADYKPDWEQVVGESENNYFKLSFKKGITYNYLYFYKNSKNEDVLKALTISTTELD